MELHLELQLKIHIQQYSTRQHNIEIGLNAQYAQYIRDIYEKYSRVKYKS